MRLKRFSRALAPATVLFVAAIPAGATTIEIGLGTGGSISTVATGTGSTGAGWAGSYSGYLFNLVLASDPTPISLGSQTLNVSLPSSWGGATGPIYVYVTERGLTSTQSALDFTSQFNASLTNGWSEIATTYVDTSNNAFGMGTQLASPQTFMNGGGSASVTTTGVSVGSPGSQFSITEVFAIFANGIFGGGDVSSESVTASSVMPAPAPPIGSGVPAMLAVGGILLGWKLLRRQQS